MYFYMCLTNCYQKSKRRHITSHSITLTTLSPVPTNSKGNAPVTYIRIPISCVLHPGFRALYPVYRALHHVASNHNRLDACQIPHAMAWNTNDVGIGREYRYTLKQGTVQVIRGGCWNYREVLRDKTCMVYTT